jgi:hypothetical protein
MGQPIGTRAVVVAEGLTRIGESVLGYSCFVALALVVLAVVMRGGARKPKSDAIALQVALCSVCFATVALLTLTIFGVAVFRAQFVWFDPSQYMALK